MKLSIIIPIFNVEQFLPQCLTSIQQQVFEDYEVLCIDDGSTDGSATIITDFCKNDSHFRSIRQENAGMSTARNRGLQEAHGDYVLFVDSDDWLIEESLSHLSGALNGEDVICFGAQKYLELTKTYLPNNRPIITDTISGWDYFNQQRLLPTEIHFVCIWQRAYRRDFLLNNNLFFSEGIRRAEDDLFSTMVMYHARTLKTISQQVYVYRVRNNSITTTVNINRWYDSLKVQEILADFFIPKDNIDKHVLYRVLASNYINWFSTTTLKLYGNRDRELTSRINWSDFKQVCLTPRHKRLYHLIRLSPAFFRFHEKLMTKLFASK